MLVSPVILWTHYVFILVLADVIANDFGQLGVICRCYCHVALGLQLMLSVLAGVIAMLLCCSLWQMVMLLPSG